MSKISLIFDVDNTLTDYDYTNRYAISKVFNEAGKCMREADYNSFKRFEIDYWRQFENSSQEMNTHGFSRIDYVRSHIYQEYFGEDVISLEFGYHLMNVYINNLGVINKVYDGVPETLEYLYHKYRLYIASNGPQESQIRKLVNTNLYQYFEGIVSSELAGYSKPKQEFFDYLIREFNINPITAAFIGDSLTSDILGANRNNICSIWFNRLNEKNITNIVPDIEIHDIKELKKIL